MVLMLLIPKRDIKHVRKAGFSVGTTHGFVTVAGEAQAVTAAVGSSTGQ